MSNGGNQPRQPDPSAIIAFYQVTAAEVTRYRDYEWKIAFWALLLIVAIIRLPEFILPNNTPNLQTLAFLSVIAVMISSAALILFCNNQFIKNRRVLRRCEVRLNLDDFRPLEWRGAPESITFNHGIVLLVMLLILIGSFALFGWYSISQQTGGQSQTTINHVADKGTPSLEKGGRMTFESKITVSLLGFQTFILIFAVGFAWRQLRGAAKMRRTEAMRQVFEVLSTAEARRDRDLVYNSKVTSLEAFDKMPAQYRERCWNVAISFNNVGFLVDKGFLLPEDVYDIFGEAALRAWEVLGPIVQQERQRRGELDSTNPYYLRYFGKLATDSENFHIKRYPKNLRTAYSSVDSDTPKKNTECCT